MGLLLLVEQGAAGGSDTGAFAAFKENPWFLLLNLVCSGLHPCCPVIRYVGSPAFSAPDRLW
jgi:hypothetical protein